MKGELCMLKYVQASTQLQTFQYLKGRMAFTPEQNKTHDQLYKGYLGERKFSTILGKRLTSNCIILFGLLLDSKTNLFQMDCFLIYQNDIFLIEIKNFKGDFYIQNDKWYICSSNKEIKNPLNQLERSTYLLPELLSTYGLRYQVNPYLIFVNDEFTLYNAPQHPSIILPTQINRFVQRLNRISSNMDYRHRKLANQLITSHITKSPYEKLPEYQFSELKRGIFCKSCRSKMLELQPGKMHCQQCSYVESIDSALLRNVLEFNFLFPEKIITTSVIQEWCGIQRTSRTIRRILKRYLGYEPNCSHSYFYLENRTIKL